ncbi:MAG: hypothetical protein QXL01_04420 [Thermoplasmatales archaeon]
MKKSSDVSKVRGHHEARNAETASVREILDYTKPSSKHEGNLIRAWEDYQHKANFWRSLFLVQIPVTVIALAFAAVIFINRNITLNVPKNPLPGVYSVTDIPDSEFINFAVNFANLVFSYTPTSIERQYSVAKFFLAPNAQAAFGDIFLKQEVPVVKTTGANQIFVIDPLRTKVERDKNLVKVFLTGERVRILAGREARYSIASTEITLRTFPHNNLNPYGIMVVDFKDLRDASK